MKGFWYSHCVWFFMKSPYRTERYVPWLREDPIVMWQHRWYVPIVLSGLALPFLVGYAYKSPLGGAHRQSSLSGNGWAASFTLANWTPLTTTAGGTSTDSLLTLLLHDAVSF